MGGLVFICVVLTACSQNDPARFVDISPQAQAADFPELAPIADLVANAKAPTDTQTLGDDLEARVARLKARARALRGRDIFSGQERLKLLRATLR